MLTKNQMLSNSLDKKLTGPFDATEINDRENIIIKKNTINKKVHINNVKIFHEKRRILIIMVNGWEIMVTNLGFISSVGEF